MQINLSGSATLIQAQNHVERLADNRHTPEGQLFHQLINLNFKFAYHVTDFMKSPMDASGISNFEKGVLVTLRFIVALIPLMCAALADMAVTIFSDRNEQKKQLINEIAKFYAETKYSNITNLNDNLKASEINDLFIKCYFLDNQQTVFGTSLKEDSQYIVNDETKKKGIVTNHIFTISEAEQ